MSNSLIEHDKFDKVSDQVLTLTMLDEYVVFFSQKFNKNLSESLT